MKIIFSVLVFLYSMSAAAQSNRYDDGSYYNDDYLHEEDLIQKTQDPAKEGVAVGEPDPNGNGKPRGVPPRKWPLKKRKPANSFQEVRTGGSMGDFKEVGGGANDTNHSRGSK